MDAHLFWFSDEQWAKIEPRLPANQPVLKAGCRWVDCPKEYGPHKTIYNRFPRRSERGIWQKIFEAVASPSEPPERVALDTSRVKAHRCASGGKGGPNFRRSDWRKAAATAKSTRSPMSSSGRGC